MKRTWIFSLAQTILLVFMGGCATDMRTHDWVRFSKSAEKSAPSAKSMEEFFSKVRRHPGNRDSHYLLGRYYQDRGEHGKAVEEFQKVLRIDPEYAPAHNSLGVCYDQMKDYPHAVSYYKMALFLNPRLDYVHNNLGYSYLLQGNVEAAIPALKEAIALNGRDERFHNNLGLAYALKGQLDLALAQFREGGSEAKAHFNLAQFYYRTGLHSLAKFHYALAFRLDPSFTHARQAWEAVSTLAGIMQTELEKTESKKEPEVSSQEVPVNPREANGTSDSLSSEPQTPARETRNLTAGTDTPQLPPAPKGEAASPGGLIPPNAPSTPPGVEASPSKEKMSTPASGGIEVSNGNGKPGMARKVGQHLKESGLPVKRYTNADHFHHPRTKIYYRVGGFDTARRVAAEMPGWELEKKGKWDRTDINVKVLIGKDIVPMEVAKRKE